MTEEKNNGGGKLDLLVDLADVEYVCNWIRDALDKEPIEVTSPWRKNP